MHFTIKATDAIRRAVWAHCGSENLTLELELIDIVMTHNTTPNLLLQHEDGYSHSQTHHVNLYGYAGRMDGSDEHEGAAVIAVRIYETATARRGYIGRVYVALDAKARPLCVNELYFRAVDTVKLWVYGAKVVRACREITQAPEMPVFALADWMEENYPNEIVHGTDQIAYRVLRDLFAAGFQD